VRPHDPRGYPIPAITPWEDGVPRFGVTSVARTFLCAIERRCSICATVMAPGPVWRVVGGEESDAIADALAAGDPYRNAAPTAEAPGHRVCMLYAAMTCPYLSRPNARRGTEVEAAGVALTRGTRRGAGGAVVGFQMYDFSYAGEAGVLFRFDGLVEFLPHDLGADQLPHLQAAVDDEPPMEAAPAYLGTDERAANDAFTAYLGQLLG
jgi:hypothetical protein